MALVHETGAGLANAESYITAAATDTRMSALGEAAWALLTTAQKEESLRRATLYMTQAYRTRWMGYRLTAAQALDWPRYGVCVDGFPIDTDIVPTDIANACADLALKAAAGDLNADLERAVIREKVGPLETEYSPYSQQSVRYPAITMALAPYLTGSGANARLVRA